MRPCPASPFASRKIVPGCPGAGAWRGAIEGWGEIPKAPLEPEGYESAFQEAQEGRARRGFLLFSHAS